MLSCLRHGTVGCGNDEDCAVHLRRAGNHVFDVVRVSRAVNVRIVARVRLIFNVSCVYCDASRFLFGGLVDLVITHNFGFALHSHNHGDSRSQSGLAVVNVTYGTDIDVGLASVKLLFCHFECPPLKFLI